jgi:hypothetical protein
MPFFRDESSKLDLIQTFPLYAPCSAGSYQQRAQLTIQTINEVFPSLTRLIDGLDGPLISVQNITEFPKTGLERKAVAEIKPIFDTHGSDKSNQHNYHFLYGPILYDKIKITNILEIGLGTNNTDMVSNMGKEGIVGASLRAFRDFCPNAQIIGLEVDRRVLFNEERITTYYVDQVQAITFDELLPRLPQSFDLIIDDGLHSPDANLNSLKFGLGLLKQGGFVVIEDIGKEAIPLWQIVAKLLGEKYSCSLWNADGAIVFTVKKLK